MAGSKLPSLLLFFVLVAVAVAAASEERALVTPTLIQCDQAQAQAHATANATAFRANVLSLLGALPSAAARTGFASLRSAGRDRAFARGLCFSDAAPSRCRACLAVAAKKLTDGCGTGTGRAGVWTDGCFVSYAAANASSPSYDGFRARVISGADPIVRDTSYELQSLADLAWHMAPSAAASAKMRAAADWTAVAADYSMNSTVRVLAQCARDRTPAECAWCLQYSAQTAETCCSAGNCCWGLGAWRDGVAAAVVGFDCYLRFEVATAPAPAPLRVPMLQRIGMLMHDHPVLAAVFAFVVGVAAFYVLFQGIDYWMEKSRGINNAAVAAVPAPVAVRASQGDDLIRATADGWMSPAAWRPALQQQRSSIPVVQDRTLSRFPCASVKT